MLHELTHSIEDSGLYDEYAKAVLAMRYGVGPEAQARITADTLAYQERYNRELPKLKEQDSSIDATPLEYDDAQKELVADLTYDVLFKGKDGKVDNAAIRQLTREHEPLAKRIWSALTRFVKKLTGINDSAVTRIEQVRDMFAQALDEVKANRQTSEGRTQYMFRDSSGKELTITDQEIYDNRSKVAAMSSVETIRAEETERFIEGEFITEGLAYFNEIGGHATNPVFGDVILDRFGLDHIVGKKFTTSTKAILIPFIKPTIEKGFIVGLDNNHHGKPIDTLTLAAKGKVGTDEYLIGVIVNQNNGGTRGQQNKYSFHTGIAIPIKERTAIYERGPVRDAAPVSARGDSSVYRILQEIAEINAKSGEISYSLPEDLDDDYMAAVEAGEMDEAQRMVDEAAREAGYTIKAYHGTNAEFTKFSYGKQGTNYKGYLEFGAGFYFTPSGTEAKQWAERGATANTGTSRVMSVYLSAENILGADDRVPGGDKYLINMGVPKADAYFIAGRAYRFIDYLIKDKGFTNAEAQETLKALGFDAIDSTYGNRSNGQYVVFDPSQIKSADPITYDNAGEVIPLSERFNDQSDDIRYSLPSDDLLEEMIRNYVGEELGEYGFPTGTLADRSRASYNRNANPNEANNNKDHRQHMQSPQQIAKRLARNLNIGAAIGTRNMNGMSPATRGYYTQRARAIGIRNTSANSFVTGMHELGHGVSERIATVGTPEMIAKLPADFVANYSASELPYEAFAEFFWQYMTQDNKAVPFAGQAFVDDVEQKMKDAGIWNNVQKARDGMMFWIEGSTYDRIGSVIHDRSEGQKMPIKDWFRSMVDQVTDATYAAERVNAMIREQTGQKTLPITEDLRQMARMKNFAARQAFNILTNNLIDPSGTIIGDSLGDRLTAAGFRATDQNIDLLIRYMLALHSLNRDAEGKPVFDEHITPRARQDFINDVQNNHPEIARAEEAFQAFRKDFLKAWMVDTGFMTQDAFDLFNQIYPHYVPTLRVKDARYHDQNQQGGRRYTVRRAVGSTEDIWNPMDSFVGMVNSIVNMVSTNRAALAWENAYRNYDGMGAFGREITEDVEATQVDLSDLSRKIENILDTEVEDDVLQDVLDLMKDGMTSFRRTNNTTMPNGIMVQHADGTRSFFEIFDTELYKLLASVQENTHNPIFESIGRLTHMMAGLTTGSNPIFAARNFMRDFQTSVNYGSWASNYATGFAKWMRAAYEVWKSSSPIASKIGLDPEKAYEEYTALGGGGWTRIQADTKQGADEYRQGIFQHGYNTRNVGSTARFLGQKLWNTLSFARLNEIVEQTSRYAEYRFGKHDRSTPEGRMEAFLAAQDATVDFARKGNGAVAQTLKQLIPFFGASMQGVARTARSVTESERARTPIRFLKTVINTGLLSALASLLLYANSDDDEKEEFVRMSNSLKAMHIYFPNFAPEILGEAPLIRVPVGQDPLMYAIHGAVTDAIWNGIGDSPAIDFATIAATVLDVCNPFGNGTIFEAALGVMRNETYYGSRIIPASLDNQDPSNQYSDDTPDVFIGLGRMTGVSPNVLQYLAEQYTGFLGQIAIPALSKTEGGNAGGLKAVRDAIRKKFTSDPLTSNDVLDSFYDGRAFLNSVKAAGDSGRPLNMLRRGLDELDAEDAYDEAVSLLSTKGTVGATAKEITKYYAQISEIMADSTMTDHEKTVEVRRIRREMIEMALDAQEEIGEYKAQYFTGYDPIFSRFIPGTKIEPQK